MEQTPDSGIAAAPMDVTITGAAMPLRKYDSALISATWTDATSVEATGTLSAQVSVDAVTWFTLTDDAGVDLAFTADPSGAGAGSGGLALSEIAGRYLRAVYTATSGDAGALLTVQVFLS